MTSQPTYPCNGPAGGVVPGMVQMALDANGVPQPISITNPEPTVGASFYNTAADTAGHQIKTGAGTFYGLSVNTAGLTSTATLYDGASTAGAKIGAFSTLAQGGPVIPPIGIAFATGLFLVLTGGTPADVTISYQ